MTDPANQLATLRALRPTITDPTQAAAIDALIASLEADVARSHIQTISDDAQVGVAIAGDLHGNIYLDGRRADQAARLLRGYLEQLCIRCGALPLQALHQQARHDDRHAIGLADVYTQLAVEALVERESLSTAQDRKAFDAEAFLRDHVGSQHLPSVRRDAIWAEDADEVRQSGQGARRGIDHPLGTGAELTRMDAKDLRQIIYNAKDRRIIFTGPQLVNEAIAANQRLVLLGEPGSGKSTVLRYLALTLAEAALDESITLHERLAGWDRLGDQGRLLPIFLPLLSFARILAMSPQMTGTADELWAHIADILEPGDVRTGLAAAVHAELSDGRALLIFDGLDEVVGSASRQKVVRAVTQFAREHPHCRVVVSCRVRAYTGPQNESWQLPGWPTATLAAWRHAQQQFFIDTWYRAAVQAGSLAEAQRDSRVATLQRAVAASADLQRLATSPLLLTVMVLVHLNDGRLPEDRVTLYSRCIDILLAQWEQRGKDASDYGPLMAYIGLPDRDVQRLRPLLTQAAYTAHQAATVEDPGSLSSETLELMAIRFLRQLGHPDAASGAGKLLEYTDHRAGLIQASAASDAYGFPHLTFQEYLAGLELTGGVGPVQRILRHHRDDRWRVPIFLGIGDHVSSGKLETPYQLLNELISHPDPTSTEAQRDALFAAELTVDVGWDRLEQGGNAFRRLRRDMAHTLAAVVEGTVLPATERIRAGVLLGKLDDLRPGVCDLQRIPFVHFAAAEFQIGLTQKEYHQIVVEEQAAGYGDEARSWYKRSLDGKSGGVPSFELARYPVTNAQWALFMQADGYNLNQSWWDAAARTWLQNERRAEPEYWHHDTLGIARPNHPVVGVSWIETTAFCRWLTQHLNDGFVYRLPSELEWEYAARGSARRMYAWGNDAIDGERANFNRLHDGISAVGCFQSGATPVTRLLDMTGNVWEWTRSAYRPYPYDRRDGREDAAASANRQFTLRGGGWLNRSISLRASNRDYGAPDALGVVGFRLARHAPL